MDGDVMRTRVKIVHPGLTYDLRSAGVEGLDAAIDAVDAPDPLCLLLTSEQRAVIRENAGGTEEA